MKTSPIFFLFSLLLLLTPVSHATDSTPENLLEKGNEAYSRKAYDEAIGFYETILAKHGYSASLLFNIANSYAQKGEVGKAVLYYKRAEVLAPSHPDVVGNLDKIRTESGLFQQEPEGIDRFFMKFTMNQWAIATLLALLALTFFLVATTRTKMSKTRQAAVCFFTMLLIFTCGTGVFIRFSSLNPLVVISSDAKILISPFGSASSIGSIQEGRLTYPQKTHGEYIFITDETGRKGWIESQSVEAVY